VETESLLDHVEKIASKLGISRDTLYRVYCKDEDVPDNVLEKLLKFENELSKTCEDIDNVMRDFCNRLIVKEKEERKLELETVIKITVYVGGEEKTINIVLRDRKMIVETDIEKVCKEPSDIILGETSIYFRCGGEWVALLHNLKGDEKNRILRVLGRAS